MAPTALCLAQVGETFVTVVRFQLGASAQLRAILTAPVVVNQICGTDDAV